MKEKRAVYLILSIILLLSFSLKLYTIIKYKNQLTLGSDDLNYIKTAVYYLRTGIFTFHNYDEPTVFIMPLYPLFLAGVFRFFGWGVAGMTAVRIIQALISNLTVWLAFRLGRKLFNTGTGLTAAALTAFYIPSVISTGYALTETIFTALLLLLVYLSIEFSDRPTVWKFVVLGIVWTASVLCRPTIGLYPVFLFLFLLLCRKVNFRSMLKLGLAMGVAFIIIMTPWWMRNYREYNEFIPLAASSGNPMLQGTYVDYRQTPENTVYYKLGRNALETNRVEIETAKLRIREEFRKDFWGYLSWFTVGKTKYFWTTVFYWRGFLGIGREFVLIQHYMHLLGFAGILLLLRPGFSKYLLPVSVIVYFNVTHCVYMAFDRYAFPLLPILGVFSSYLINRIYRHIKQTVQSSAYAR